VAARRLIIVLIVLLVISTLMAALVPSIEEAREDDEPETATTTTEADPVPGKLPARPGLVRGSFEVEPDRRAASPRLELRAGERLALEVRSPEATQIRIPALGRLEWAGPGSPARFQLLARTPGEIAVEAGSGREIGRIVIVAPKAEGEDGDGGANRDEPEPDPAEESSTGDPEAPDAGTG
jgi:hypothetical protein